MGRLFRSDLPTIISSGGYHQVYVPNKLMEGVTKTVISDDCEDHSANCVVSFNANIADWSDVNAIYAYIELQENPIYTKAGEIKPTLPDHIEELGGGAFRIDYKHTK